jgi:hypothetical protein
MFSTGTDAVVSAGMSIVSSRGELQAALADWDCEGGVVVGSLVSARDDEEPHGLKTTDIQKRSYRTSRKSPVPSQCQHAVDMRKRILFSSLIYSPSFSATQARHRIQFQNRPWTSSRVRPFHTCAISFLDANSQSFRICFNIPKSHKSHGFISGEYGGCGILEM